MITRRTLMTSVGTIAVAGLIVVACAASDIATTTTTDVPAVYKMFSSDVQVTVAGDYVVLTATGVPRCQSSGYGPRWTHTPPGWPG